MDLAANLKKYLAGETASDGRKPGARYASFDYCFNYFQDFRDSGRTHELANGANLELSCLHLGFYLASWGMLRASTPLSKQSVRRLIPIIGTIADADASLWELDANGYTKRNAARLWEQAKTIRGADRDMTDTLVTKIMLGVFGSVPAFDSYFKAGLKKNDFVATKFGVEALIEIGAFYRKHAKVLDAANHRVRTLDLKSGKPTRRRYTRAKVIDMVFFTEGSPPKKTPKARRIH